MRQKEGDGKGEHEGDAEATRKQIRDRQDTRMLMSALMSPWKVMTLNLSVFP